MPARLTSQIENDARHIEGLIATRPRCRRVMVAVDDSRNSQTAIPHGVAVASALGAELTLVRVLEAMRGTGDPADPVDWQISRERARGDVEDLALQHADNLGHVETRILEGRAADQICRWAHDNQVDITVLCTLGSGAAAGRDLGRTARRVLDCATGPVLLVPSIGGEPRRVHYRRILAPLDGSSRAESALPFALRLAEAEHAELVLVHAIPEPEFTETGPPEPDDVTLRAQLVSRNERVAQDYLDRLRAHIDVRDVPVRVLLLRDGDVRHALVHAVRDQKADLVVLASHGHSGHLDVAAGSVATHLISHAAAPVLLVRSPETLSGSGGRPLPLRHIADNFRPYARVTG